MAKKKDQVEVKIEEEPVADLLKDVLKETVKVDTEEVIKEAIDTKVEADKVPSIKSPEWTPFVLGKLQPDELYNGCPTYEGLRRVCYELLGTIVDVDIDVKQTPSFQNGNHSCVVAKLTIEHPVSFDWLDDVAGRTIKYSHVGDVFQGNGNKDQYAWRFSSATCWTRVKASLLRDAFRLKHVYAKEEISELSDDESGVDGYMNPNQVDGLDMICGRINIHAEKFIKDVWKKARPKDAPHEDLNMVPFSVAAMCFGKLQLLQQKPKTIPEEIKGYVKSWKDQIDCVK